MAFVSSQPLFVPVVVQYGKMKNRIRFQLDKTPQSTVLALLRKFRVEKVDPKKWGLFRVSRQQWLTPFKQIAIFDIQIGELFVLCERQNLLAKRLAEKKCAGPPMRTGEVRSFSVTLGTGRKAAKGAKTVRYENDTLVSVVLSSLTTNAEVFPSPQDYQLQHVRLSGRDTAVFLDASVAASSYQLADGEKLALVRLRSQFNVRLFSPKMLLLGEMTVRLGPRALVADAIEYLFMQLFPKATNVKDEARMQEMSRWGIYLQSSQNEHGLQMEAARTLWSYRIKPSDWLIYKPKPKDKADMFLSSHQKIQKEARAASFITVLDESTRSQSTFKFPVGVTVQQAISKCSRKFNHYGRFGLYQPRSEVCPEPRWLEPQVVLAQYRIPNMATLVFRRRPGAIETTPNDFLGQADTTRAVPIDTTSPVVKNDRQSNAPTMRFDDFGDSRSPPRSSTSPRGPPLGRTSSMPAGFNTDDSNGLYGITPASPESVARSSANDSYRRSSNNEFFGAPPPLPPTFDPSLLDDSSPDSAPPFGGVASAAAAAVRTSDAGPKKKFCPECGYNAYVPGRFCPECGFKSGGSGRASAAGSYNAGGGSGMATGSPPTASASAMPDAGDTWGDLDDLLQFDDTDFL